MGFAQAQMTGKVIRENLGLEFTIPEGWMGQETDEAIILGSNQVAGFVYLTLHEHETMADIQQELRQGFSDGTTTHMMPTGVFEDFDLNMVGVTFEGTMEGQAAKAFVVAILNPEGYGISMMAATEANLYNTDYESVAKTIARSFRFKKMESEGEIAAWKQKLSNQALNYISSYSSGSSGGTSAESKIDLCPNGLFTFRSTSQLSVDVGGAFGSSSSQDGGTGTWEIVSNKRGGAKLMMFFDDGRAWEYELTSNDQGHTFLNGRRYFVIGPNDPNGRGPNCF
ncbi:hypothetical protein [Pararhodonellum marinum]|uniref:hypothetical protein n=1 Tax=Pararhodonellum marinum TaxID=2755358 RepID=UPI00188F90FB|nr:hypothetical protein [Pararhodonellum marinum]